MRRDSVSANYGALEHSFADLFQVSAGMLQGNIVPNDEIAVAPAVFEYALRRVEVVEQPVQRIAALLPVHPEQADGLQFADPDAAAVIVRVDLDSWQGSPLQRFGIALVAGAHGQFGVIDCDHFLFPISQRLRQLRWQGVKGISAAYEPG